MGLFLAVAHAIAGIDSAQENSGAEDGVLVSIGVGVNEFKVDGDAIYLVNVALILVWMASTTRLTFAQLGGAVVERVVSAYVSFALFAWRGVRWLYGLCRRD